MSLLCVHHPGSVLQMDCGKWSNEVSSIPDKAAGKTIPDKDAHLVAFLNMLGVFKKSISKSDTSPEFMAVSER